jgi:hypothetical protein
MALRPIDNALPTTPERPKKQAKVVVSIQKQSDSAVTDENQAPLPPSADATVDYVLSENLKAIPDPESKIQVSPLFQKGHLGIFHVDMLFLAEINFQSCLFEETHLLF